MATTFYIHCKNFVELADKVTKAVRADLDWEGAKIMYPIRFRVDDTPTREEWDRMNDNEKKNAFASANGTYGIRNIGYEFDCEGTMLAGAYYGGNAVYTTSLLTVDSGEMEVSSQVEALLGNMLLAEDCKYNYLLRIETL